MPPCPSPASAPPQINTKSQLLTLVLAPLPPGSLLCLSSNYPWLCTISSQPRAYCLPSPERILTNAGHTDTHILPPALSRPGTVPDSSFSPHSCRMVGDSALRPGTWWGNLFICSQPKTHQRMSGRKQSPINQSQTQNAVLIDFMTNPALADLNAL